MIRKLQKKFILIAMMSFLCVILVLGVGINVVNLIRIDRRTSDLLDMITSLKIPPEGFRPEGNREFPDPERPEGGKDPWFSGKRGDFKSISITPETEYTTRWFSVTFSGSSLHSVSMEKIASVSSSQAEELGRQVMDSGRDEGYREGYRYRIVSENDTKTVYFLNCEEDIRGGIFLLIATVLVGLICLIFLLILFVSLSRRAVAPVLENMERQKRFITDAGHELKTPLAILSADADVLAMTGEENEWVDSIRKQTDRMGHLVEDLLALARAEEDIPLVRAEFDLSDAVVDTAMPFAPLAKSRGKGVTLTVQSGIRYRGDENGIRRLVSILMENALKYSEDGGEITLTLRRENKKICLEQKNPCASLPEGDLSRLLDRFYRGDASRSGSGYGIGLSIAKGIVEAHKGKISVSAEGKTICFTVIL